jgi:hypothetical protein
MTHAPTLCARTSQRLSKVSAAERGGCGAARGRQMGPVTAIVTSMHTPPLPPPPPETAPRPASGKGAKAAPAAEVASTPAAVEQVITGTTRGVLQLWRKWSPPLKPPPEPQVTTAVGRGPPVAVATRALDVYQQLALLRGEACCAGAAGGGGGKTGDPAARQESRHAQIQTSHAR